MPATKDCPMCGDRMQLQQRETVVRVPGNRDASTYVRYEWVCRDCDYFEDAEEEGLETRRVR